MCKTMLYIDHCCEAHQNEATGLRDARGDTLLPGNKIKQKAIISK